MFGRIRTLAVTSYRAFLLLHTYIESHTSDSTTSRHRDPSTGPSGIYPLHTTCLHRALTAVLRVV